VNVGDRDLEQLLDRIADLDLVRTAVHLERNLVRGAQAVRLLREEDGATDDALGLHGSLL